MPLLSMRLAAPHHLVDINRVARWPTCEPTRTAVRVGALARHAELERDVAAARVQPLLARALALVAHPTIRNRGTIVGSLVHADPAAEMTAVLALLGGSVRVARAGAGREVAAADFFVGPLESAVEPGELAVEAFFPALPPRSGTAFVEVARRHGDYAVCGVCRRGLPRRRRSASRRHARPTSPWRRSRSWSTWAAHCAGVHSTRRSAALSRRRHGRGRSGADIHASAEYRRHWPAC